MVRSSGRPTNGRPGPTRMWSGRWREPSSSANAGIDRGAKIRDPRWSLFRLARKHLQAHHRELRPGHHRELPGPRSSMGPAFPAVHQGGLSTIHPRGEGGGRRWARLRRTARKPAAAMERAAPWRTTRPAIRTRKPHLVQPREAGCLPPAILFVTPPFPLAAPSKDGLSPARPCLLVLDLVNGIALEKGDGGERSRRRRARAPRSSGAAERDGSDGHGHPSADVEVGHAVIDLLQLQENAEKEQDDGDAKDAGFEAHEDDSSSA